MGGKKNKQVSGYESPDTDNEAEHLRKRKEGAEKKGIDLKKSVSFKRDKVDRHYDKYHWSLGALARLLGLNIAPMSIPFHRRIETLAVFLWMCSFLFLGLFAIGLMVYLFLYTQYWWMSVCYLCWYIPDRSICNRGGRRWQWMREWGIWKHYTNFFPIEVVKTAELPPEHNYIMGYHPHGILCAGAFASYATEGTNWKQLFPGLTPTLLTLEMLFWIPFYRELFLCSGACSATKASMDHLLGTEDRGRALCLVIGGAPESLDCHPGDVVLHLEKRRGFAKMALRHGTSLVPTFAFGETDIYDQIPNKPGSWIRTIQDYMRENVFGIPLCGIMGRGIFQYSFGIVPFRLPIFLVVGAPIHVEAVKNPTWEQILALQARYKEALTELFNTHKHTYARNPNVTLSFV